MSESVDRRRETSIRAPVVCTSEQNVAEATVETNLTVVSAELLVGLAATAWRAAAINEKRTFRAGPAVWGIWRLCDAL